MSVISKEARILLNTGSTLRVMFEEGKRMRKLYGTEKVYDFSLGNPNAPTPPEFNKALKVTIDHMSDLELHGYMSNAGYDDVRQAIAGNINHRFGTHYDMSNFTMTVGAANALVVALKVLLDPGDEVAVFAPFFLEYRNYISNFGGVTTVVPPNPPTFNPDPKALADTITERTKAVIINTPNNPTGLVYSEAVIKEMADVLRAKEQEYGHSIFIISDEPYRELVYNNVSVPFIPKLYRNTVIAYSYSKALSIPGERIGYLLVPDAVDESADFKAATSNCLRAVGCVNAPSLQQKAIMQVLDCTTDIDFYAGNHRKLTAILDECGFEYAKAEGTFYLFVKTPIEDDKEFVRVAKEEYHIICSEGSAFMCPGYVRFAYCVEPAMIDRSHDAFVALAKRYGLR